MPNPLLAQLLVEISDPDELRLTLRAIWALHQKRGFPPSLTQADLASDPTVAAMIGADGEELQDRISGILDQAVQRGTLLRTPELRAPHNYYLNTEPVRRALAKRRPELHRAAATGSESDTDHAELETWPYLNAALKPTPAAVAYEENIGPITPMVAEKIRDAISEYSENAVMDAIREAVERDARNWSYVAAVLRRPRREKQTEHGKPGGNSQEVRSDQFIRWYRNRQQQRGNR